MIPEVKLLTKDVYGRIGSYWTVYEEYDYVGKAVIEFETVTKMRNFINRNTKIVSSNGKTFKIIKRRKSRSKKFHCEVHSMTLRELNLELIGI
jgi:hypothetical protein